MSFFVVGFARIMPIVCWLGLAVVARSATYVVDPASGSDQGTGTAESPWRTLASVLGAKHAWQPGDVILLRSGDHGHPILRGAIADGEVTIQAAEGQTPQIGSLTIRGAAHWTISGLLVSPEGVAAGKRAAATLVMIDAESRDITVRGCEIFSARDSSKWTEADWSGKSVSGINCDGNHCTIAENRLRNVRFGIGIGPRGRNSVVLHNVIEDFMNDGLRGLADDCRFEGNTVKNCYAIDKNHDDGFQSWSIGENGRVGQGVVKGIVLRGNTFISYTDPAQPFKAAMQGIGCFDGMFEDWIIENNVVVTDMWHGIAFYGAKNCRIVNNTVVKNPVNAAARTPWIYVSPHKHGAASTGNIVRNNITPTLKVPAGTAVADHNLATSDYAALFVDYAKYDLHLRPGSAAIDAGTDSDAPREDRDGKKRTAPYDLGAYEFVKR